MSDEPTPRTDQIVKLIFEGNEFVSVKYAHKLERESDQLAKQCVVFVEEIAELRKDSARLDWLESHPWRSVNRKSIDKGMKGPLT